MPEHYYTENPTSHHQEIVFTHKEQEKTLTFQTDAGVFSKAHMDVGTLLLLDTLPPCVGHVLDLGCGWGALGVCFMARNPQALLTASDINVRAVSLTRANLDRNALVGEVIQSNGFENITGTFEIIACNPPIRAGKAVIYDLFKEARNHLTCGGALYVVIRKQQGAPSALTYLRTLYAEVEVVERGSGFWVLRAQG